MAIDQAEHAARWIDVATRLREVRDAERRFIDLWNFEQADVTPTTPAMIDADDSTDESHSADRWTSSEAQSSASLTRPRTRHRRQRPDRRSR